MPKSIRVSNDDEAVAKSIRRHNLRGCYRPSWDLLAQVHVEIAPILDKQNEALSWGLGDRERHNYGKALRQFNRTLAPA